MEKYQNLERQIKKMWKIRSIKVVSVLVAVFVSTRFK